MTNKELFAPTHPGLSRTPEMDPSRLHFAFGDHLFGGHPANELARLMGKRTHWTLGNGVYIPSITATATNYPLAITITDNAGGATGSVGYDSAGVLVLTVDDANTAEIRAKAIELPSVLSNIQAGKPMHVCAGMRIASTDVAHIGYAFGLGVNASAASGLVGNDHTDELIIRKGVAAGTVTGRVRGNSGTAAASATLITQTASVYSVVGFSALIGSTAAECAGFFYANGTKTQFSDDQKTQLFAMLTTPPQLAFFFHILTDDALQNSVKVMRGFAYSDLYELATVDY